MKRIEVLNAAKWDAVGGIALKFGNLVVSLVLARMLGPEVFGTLAIASFIIAISQTFINAGFSSAIVNASEISDVQLNTVFIINILLN